MVIHEALRNVHLLGAPWFYVPFVPLLGFNCYSYFFNFESTKWHNLGFIQNHGTKAHRYSGILGWTLMLKIEAFFAIARISIHFSCQCARKIVLNLKQNDMVVPMSSLITQSTAHFSKWQNFHFTKTIGIRNFSTRNLNHEIKQPVGGSPKMSTRSSGTGDPSEIQIFLKLVRKIFSNANQWPQNQWSAQQKIVTRKSTGLKIKIISFK